ncbi:MAG: peptide ABC transporter substrate-binding protein [Pseudomonadales bacterium]|nr:peptide ABC transporter substrate-binding protein [Pseudomonadales bacterium]
MIPETSVKSRIKPGNSSIKQLLWLGLAAGVFFIFLALILNWASSNSDSTQSSEGVDITANSISLALDQEPPQLDSTRTSDAISGIILGHVMEGLLRFDKNKQLAPAVAERWEITPTGATFWLRNDARWSDGTQVTAHDFIFAWKKVLNPATASQYAFFLYPLKNAEAINSQNLSAEALGARALDDLTIEIEFEKPISYFDKLVAFTTFFPMQESFYNKTQGRYGADADTILYNGPFIISEWVHSAKLLMEKNPHYWNNDSIKLNAINWSYITADTTAKLNLFKDKRTAFVQLDAETLESALNNRWTINQFSDGTIFYIEFNHRDERITRNYHLRRAMQLVNNSNELVYKVIKLPGNIPGVSLFPGWLQGEHQLFRQEYPPPAHNIDIENAKHHLELARKELGLEEFPALVMLTSDSPTARKQSEYYQNLFKRTLGLNIKIDLQIFKQRLAKMLSGDFDLVMGGWGPDYQDPLTFGDLFASWNIQNRGRYNNPALDKSVRIAQNSLEPPIRMKAFADIQDILYNDAVIIPNYERGRIYVLDPRVKGLVRRIIGADPDFSRAYLVQEPAGDD